MKRTAGWFLFCLLFWVSCTRSPDTIWKFKTGGYIYGSPAVAGRNLIIGSNDGYLYGLDLQSGKEVWKTGVGVHYVSSVVPYRDSILVGSDSGNMTSVDPISGSVRWQFPTKGLIHYTSCTDDTGIYFGSQDNIFYKLAPDGTKIWEFAAGHRLWATCVFYKDLVLATSWDSRLYALDRQTGKLRWSHSSGKINYGSPEISGDDVLYTSHQKYFRLDAASGQVRKEMDFPYADYLLLWNQYLWVAEGHLSKRSLDGTEIASAQVRSDPEFKPVPGSGFLIVGGTDTLYGVSPEMKVLWKYRADDAFWAPGVIHEGVYYTGNRNKYVYAVRLP